MMKKLILVISFTVIGFTISAQVVDIVNRQTSKTDNIVVEKISNASESTSFVIWVRDTVKPHFHKTHTETLYLVEGTGYFYLDGKKHVVKSGDFFSIKPNQIHSFKNLYHQASKFLSIQAPEFKGEDRHFVD